MAYLSKSYREPSLPSVLQLCAPITAACSNLVFNLSNMQKILFKNTRYFGFLLPFHKFWRMFLRYLLVCNLALYIYLAYPFQVAHLKQLYHFSKRHLELLFIAVVRDSAIMPDDNAMLTSILFRSCFTFRTPVF